MATAFVFINTIPGTEAEVLRKLREFPEIKESYFVYGVFDVIAKVEADSLDHLKDTTTAVVGEGK